MPYPKTDRNQKKIVQHLRDLGCEVKLTHMVKGGFPDLIVRNPKNGRLRMIEVKMPGKKLNDKELAFHRAWGDSVFIAHTPEEAEEGMQLGAWRR